VVSLRRRWVIQLGEWVAIQARIPVAAAPAVIALAMHCMHMGLTVAMIAQRPDAGRPTAASWAKKKARFSGPLVVGDLTKRRPYQR